MFPQALQAASLPVAVNNGSIWTQADMDYVKDTMGRPLLEVAQHLGRTYASVAIMRSLVRSHRVVASRRERAAQARVDRRGQASQVCPVHFIVLPVTGKCGECE
jgi:hypothetical protein